MQIHLRPGRRISRTAAPINSTVTTRGRIATPERIVWIAAALTPLICQILDSVASVVHGN